MFSKRFIRLEGFRYEIAHLTDAALEVRAHERDELIARIRIHPHAVLQTDESLTLDETPELIARATTSFIDVKNEYAPLPIPECRFGYRHFSKLYLLQYLLPFFCNLDLAFRVLARHCYETGLLQTTNSLPDALIELRAILRGAIQLLQ